jgi:hypothetical protein
LWVPETKDKKYTIENAKVVWKSKVTLKLCALNWKRESRRRLLQKVPVDYENFIFFLSFFGQIDPGKKKSSNWFLQIEQTNLWFMRIFLRRKKQIFGFAISLASRKHRYRKNVKTEMYRTRRRKSFFL